MPNVLKFVQLPQASYDAKETSQKLSTTLFFTSDTHRLYKGTDFFCNEIVTTVKDAAGLKTDSSVVLNRLYVNTTTKAMYVATAIAANNNTIVQIGADETTLNNVSSLLTTIATPAASKVVTTNSSSTFEYTYEVTDSIASSNASSTKLATQNAVRSAINDLDVSEVGGTGKVITTISQADGKISATAIDLTSSSVARAATTGDHAIEATDVQGALVQLRTAIDASTANQKEYKLVSITGADLTALGTNVKQAYKLQVSVNGGAYADESNSSAIKIYKDSSVKEIYLGTSEDTIDSSTGVITKVTQDKTDADKQYLCYAYQSADGTYSMTKIDVTKFLSESQFKDGLQVSNSGQVSLKLDTTSTGAQNFLSITPNGGGLKISGVADAISTAINAKIDNTITSGDSAQIVTVSSVGKLQASGKKVGGQALAATTDADTLATEKAVQTAITALDTSLTASKGVKRVTNDFELDFAQTGTIQTAAATTAVIAALDGNTLKFNNTAIQAAINYAIEQALTWQVISQ